MRKIKWGVIGTAGIAEGCTIPGMIEAENCELYAIAGRSLEKAERFRESFGFQKAYGSYEELLKDPEVEAVYIALPNDMHEEWVRKAASAKKHILCEKPLAPNPEILDSLIKTAEDNGVFLMEAFAYLHSPAVAAIKEVLDSGVIGELRYMESAFITSDYDISNIRMQKKRYGGCTYDLGCYCTSQILWLTEMEPARVQAIAEFTEDEKIDVLTTGILRFDNGFKANFTCGMTLATDADKRIDRLQIHGTKGSISSDIEFNQCGALSFTVTTADGSVTKTIDTPQNYRLEVEQLGRCILDGETPFVSNDFSRKNARLLAKVLKEIDY